MEIQVNLRCPHCNGRVLFPEAHLSVYQNDDSDDCTVTGECFDCGAEIVVGIAASIDEVGAPMVVPESNGEEPHRAWYYDETGDGEIVREFGDPDDGSILVWLCDQCAQELDCEVSLASEDDLNEAPCWRCGR